MDKKKELRKHILQQSRSTPLEARLHFSRQIWNKLEQLKEFQQSRVVVLYWSLNDEVFTHDVIEKYFVDKKILLPAIVADNLELKRFTNINQLHPDSKFGINEPVGEAFTELDSIDLIIVPGVAFDTRCFRLGRGKGFYDRFLQKVNSVLTIGVCFDHQLVDEIPVEKHDIPMDWVVTPSVILKREEC